MGGGTSASIIAARQSAGNGGRKLPPPRKVFFCHSCCSFSYNSYSDSPRDCASLICPHPFCQPRSSMQLEEIPASVEGSLRLQVIMLELINSRAAARSRTIKPIVTGVRTCDIILGTNVLKLKSGDPREEVFCSVCNDNFGCCEPQCGTDVTAVDSPSIMELECGHAFHQSCILPWLSSHTTCPCCRAVVKQWLETPLPEQLREIFDESQLMRKIDFALTTKAYLIAKEIESAMISDRKEDSQLIKTSYTLECPSSELLCDVDKKEELSNRLHGLLLRVTNV
jgi:hypothetical protein